LVCMAEVRTKTNLIPLLEEDGDDVLSPELRRSFDRLRELSEEEGREKKRAKRDGCNDRPSEERFRLAVYTMTMAQNEMLQMERGIAELEALLEEEEDCIDDSDSEEEDEELRPKEK